ncbi:MAG: DUF2889 domain-containing protein [Actinomycetota bacterium]|nr:DUF2889 domain-containing protein [Actinomycetota bacterium]
MHEFFDDIVPPPEGVDADADLLHERAYVVRVYRKSDQCLVVRGAVRDQKPPGLYIVGDPEPLTVHHMIIDLEVALPSLEITAARAVMEAHPYPTCPQIMGHYSNLVGLSIARGFTHKVRELFGGPRGCTHTTALLQAMGPAVVQSTWSMRVLAMRQAGGTGGPDLSTVEARQRAIGANLNSCHVWEEGGEHSQNILDGGPPVVPVWVHRRFGELGRDPNTWRNNDA